MKTWKISGILFFLLLVIYSVYVTFLNYDSLKEPFYLTGEKTTSTGVFLLIAFFAGFLIMGFRFLLESFRRDREARQSRKALQSQKIVQDKIALMVWQQLRERGPFTDPFPGLRSADEHPLCSFIKNELVDISSDEETYLKRLKELSARHPNFEGLKIIHFLELLTAGLNDEAESMLESIHPGPSLENIMPVLKRNLAISRKKWKESVAIQKKIVAKSPNREANQRFLVGLQYEYAKELFLLSETKPALGILKGLQKEHEKFIPTWVTTGDLYLKQGDSEKALSTWKEGFFKTKATILLHRMTDYYLENEHPEKAIEEIADIIYKSENDILPRFFLGRLYYRLEMHEEALREFNIIKPRVSHSPTLNYLFGVLQDKLGHPEKATAAFRRAISEIGGLKSEYFCIECQNRFANWSDRCETCGSWNSIEVDYPEEKTLPTDLGLEPYPIRFPVA